jgi:hypothetical protein
MGVLRRDALRVVSMSSSVGVVVAWSSLAVAGPPRWDARAYPTAQFVVGMGSCGVGVPAGERLRCAVQKASEEIALSIRARVTAHRERRVELVTSRGAAGASGRLNAAHVQSGAATSDVELVDLRTVERSCGGPQEPCHALVVLERASVVERLRRRHEQDARTLEYALEVAARAGNPVTRIGAGMQAATTARQMDDSAALMAAVSTNADAPSSVTPAALARRSTGLEDLAVCLTSTTTDIEPALIFAGTRALLQGAGVSHLSIAPSGRCESTALTITLAGGWQPNDEHELAPEIPGALDLGPIEPLPSSANQGLEVARFQGGLAFELAGVTLAGSHGVIARGVANSATRARLQAQDLLSAAIAARVREAVSTCSPEDR